MSVRYPVLQQGDHIYLHNLWCPYKARWTCRSWCPIAVVMPSQLGSTPSCCRCGTNLVDGSGFVSASSWSSFVSLYFVEIIHFRSKSCTFWYLKAVYLDFLVGPLAFLQAMDPLLSISRVVASFGLPVSSASKLGSHFTSCSVFLAPMYSAAWLLVTTVLIQR